jgi:hypothetical protein
MDIPRYEKAPALWVLTVYYNPCGYQSRRDTYDTFIESMHDSGINVLTVECAFGDDPFALSNAKDVIQIRSASLFWQKERLINIGASYLPDSCTFVAWVDCDVIFLNPHWATEACARLSHDATVVQLFEMCSRLARGNVAPEVPDRAVSFAAKTTADISTLQCGRYDMHGHTGYAWAMRRGIFDELGLYDRAVTGSADHFMAHAVWGTYGFCIENALKHDHRQIDHFKSWGDRFYAHTQGKLAAVSGEILHLWHGSLARRDYFRRMWKVTEYGYDPFTDLVDQPGKPLEWQPWVLEQKPELVAYFAEYFASRKEDQS